VRDDAAHRGAPLSGRAGRGEDDAAHGQVEIRAGADDGRVVAPELEQRAPEPPGDPRPHGLAHPRRPGGAEQRDSRMVDQGLSQLGTTDEHLRDVGRRVELRDGLLEDRGAGQRRQGGELRRLPDHRVTADEGHCRVPRPDRGREVEGADHADHAQRVPGLHQSVSRALGGHGPAVQLARQPDREVADVDHLLDLAAGLGGDLADLEADQRGQVVLVLGEQLTPPLDEGTAPGSRDPAPGEERLVRPLDGIVHRSDVAPRQPAEHLAVDR
jgi:hypothetical protein